MHDEILRKKEEQDREKPHRHLFRFPHMGMWTKLRPGIWNFLEKVTEANNISGIGCDLWDVNLSACLLG